MAGALLRGRAVREARRWVVREGGGPGTSGDDLTPKPRFCVHTAQGPQPWGHGGRSLTEPPPHPLPGLAAHLAEPLCHERGTEGHHGAWRGWERSPGSGAEPRADAQEAAVPMAWRVCCESAHVHPDSILGSGLCTGMCADEEMKPRAPGSETPPVRGEWRTRPGPTSSTGDARSTGLVDTVLATEDRPGRRRAGRGQPRARTVVSQLRGWRMF